MPAFLPLNILKYYFNNKIDIGKWGEQQARKLLKRKGYSIIGKRVHIGRHDEIDIIARNKDVLIFIEVKTRKNTDFGRPRQTIKTNKKHSISRGAVKYLKALKHPPEIFRFDVIEVIGSPYNKQKPEINHIENAFPLQKPYRPPL
jgi:putative endonuclease